MSLFPNCSFCVYVDGWMIKVHCVRLPVHSTSKLQTVVQYATLKSSTHALSRAIMGGGGGAQVPSFSDTVSNKHFDKLDYPSFNYIKC